SGGGFGGSPTELSAAQKRSARILLAITAVLFVTLAVWTVLIATTSFVGFGVGWSRTRLSPESIGLVTSVIAAVLVYLRYSVSGSPRLLFLALAFVALAFSQLVLGAGIGETAGLAPQLDVYLWTAGRVGAAVLFVVGATKAMTRGTGRPGSASTFLTWTAAIVAGMGLVDLLIWAV